jgi:hypothetical protein
VPHVLSCGVEAPHWYGSALSFGVGLLAQTDRAVKQKHISSERKSQRHLFVLCRSDVCTYLRLTCSTSAAQQPSEQISRGSTTSHIRCCCCCCCCCSGWPGWHRNAAGEHTAAAANIGTATLRNICKHMHLSCELHYLLIDEVCSSSYHKTATELIWGAAQHSDCNHAQLGRTRYQTVCSACAHRCTHTALQPSRLTFWVTLPCHCPDAKVACCCGRYCADKAAAVAADFTGILVVDGWGAAASDVQGI